MFRNKRLNVLIIVMMIVALAIPAQMTQAAPDAVGCTIYVNSTSVDTTTGFYMTLPVAIMVANGGTGPQGLNRTLTDNELLQLSGGGCSWDGSGNLVTGGAGYVDTIRFANIIGQNPTIVLAANQPLRALGDAAGDVLDGSYTNIYPTIDATAIGANHDGLTIGSNATINGVRVTGAPRWDFNVYGTNNHLINIAAWSAGDNGIDIRADGNVVDGALVGVASASTTTCGTGSANKGNGRAGISISTAVSYPSAQNNVIKNSVINCNGKAGTYPGISLSGSGATRNTIGSNNLIGTRIYGGGPDLGNSGDGISISGSASSNTIVTNTLANNGAYGVSIVDANSTNIGGNAIRFNSLDGVYVGGYALNTVIGGPSFLNALSGNWIGANSHNGIDLVGSNVQYTIVAGNAVGSTLDGLTPDGNHLSGVVVDGARDNYIGDNVATPNTIGGNLLNGVVLIDGANGNSVAHNTIGNVHVPNVFYGVMIDSGAHDNVIGMVGNTIDDNHLGGVLIQGSTTATNTVIHNYIESSNSFGVALRNGTFGNLIGQVNAHNTIDYNAGQGIEISGGSHHNVVTEEQILYNGLNGIRITGAGTTGNIITGTHIAGSGYDAISEGNGAAANAWLHLATGNNGGMAIDKNANSDATNVPDGPAPTISSVVYSHNVLTVTGTADASGFLSPVQVDAYFVRLNQHGYLEATYWDSAPVTISGTWTMTRTGALYPGVGLCLAASETTTIDFFDITTTSTELGTSNCRTTLPVVLR
jgi:hypothetical protein